MKTTSTGSFAKVLPVLFGFFIMGFVDVVGISTSYAKIDFNLSETLAGFIPSMVFFWFLLLSIPAAGLMNRIGRKKTVQISNVVTIIGMTVPFISYNFYTCMVAFALLGIGNTILQVSLNPLLTNVVRGEALTSSLTVGQVVKAVSSFCGPFIAAFAAKSLGSWQYLFPVFAGVSLLSAAWLMTATIKEEAPVRTTNMGAVFSLLKKKTILLCFLAIVFVVGVDVGMNTVAPKLLMERAGIAVENAGFASSIYFFCRTVGALIGAILLVKMSDMKYYRIHVFIALAALLTLYFMQGQMSILVMVGIIGYACSSLFAVIFSQVIKAFPERVNDISGLMITGIFGGAIAPPFMGYATDTIGNQTGSLLVISACLAYLVIFAFLFKIAKQ